MKKKAIIIGASSGIGEALAYVLDNESYSVGLVARRESLLKEIQQKLKNKSFTKKIDITDINAHVKLQELIDEMKDVDLIIINSGIGFRDSYKEWSDSNFTWEKEKNTVLTNILGFAEMALYSYNYFLKKGKGHIVGVSSIASLVPNPYTPSYSASKAFVSNFLASLRIAAFKSKKDIVVTDIIPGFVDTPIIKNNDKVYWMATVKKAANQIFLAILKKKKKAYITKRWALIAYFAKILPESLLKRAL